MPKIFTTLDKIKPAYDITYKVVLFICKLLLILDILITTMSVIGRYVPFIPDPAWSEEVVLTCMSFRRPMLMTMSTSDAPFSMAFFASNALDSVSIAPRGKPTTQHTGMRPARYSTACFT